MINEKGRVSIYSIQTPSVLNKVWEKELSQVQLQSLGASQEISAAQLQVGDPAEAAERSLS